MSFSNADTGSKNADPYKEKNKDETSVKEKVEDFTEFVSKAKFGMMTTRDGQSGHLASRCMALAGKVCFHFQPLFPAFLYTSPASMHCLPRVFMEKRSSPC